MSSNPIQIPFDGDEDEFFDADDDIFDASPLGDDTLESSEAVVDSSSKPSFEANAYLNDFLTKYKGFKRKE